MIDYVNNLLKHWAQEMSVHRPGGHLGYGGAWMGGAVDKPSSHVRIRPLTARGVASPRGAVNTKIGVIAEQVHQAVARLPEELQTVIHVQYLDSSAVTRELKAEALGCSTKTLYKHIHRAHELLSDDLPDSYARFGASYPPVDKPSPLA